MTSGPAIPAIYDTDVGTDPDDTCVLILVARHPEVFRPALILTNDETPSLAKARFAAQILAATGRDIPLAAGLASARGRAVDLAERSGLIEVAEAPPGDAVERVIDVLERHPVVDYFGLGALTNLAVALDRRPDLAARVRLHQMGPALLGAHPRDRTQYNARVDPAAFRRVLAQVPTPTLVLSHATWTMHPSGRPQLGVFPDDPIGQALASAPRADLALMSRHLAAFIASGKGCSIMHDPLTVLAAHHAGLVDTVELDVILDELGWLHLPAASRALLAALPAARIATIARALEAPLAAPAQPAIRVRMSIGADCATARRLLVGYLFEPAAIADGDGLADRWGDHGHRTAPLGAV